MIRGTSRLARSATRAALGAALVASVAGTVRAQEGGSRAVAPDGRPWNFVFILADDMGWNQTGYGWNRAGYPGTGYYETPHIDRIAAEGMIFTDAYAAASICSPSRAAIMTGRDPARLHVTDYIPGAPYPYAKVSTPRMSMMLPLSEVTIPEMLKEKGYVSGHFGKWHLNVDKNYEPGRPGDPASQGFDDVLATVKPEADADPYADPHHAHEITRRSLEFLDAHGDEPFFLYVSHHVVHRPLHETPEHVARYDAKRGTILQENNPTMGAMIQTMDEGIGKILARLEALGIADRTVVIFYSDNGGLEMLQDQEPLRGGKAMLWEGGIRVPLAIDWPGVVEPGSVSHVPVTGQDFLPTIAEIAGIDANGPEGRTLDGVSLVPILEGGAIADRALHWHYPHYHHLGYKPSGAIREGDYKLIEWYEESLTGGEGAVTLYDVTRDIGEVNDLSEAMPEKTAEMLEDLRAWRKAVGAQEMTPNPDWDPQRETWRFETGMEDPN